MTPALLALVLALVVPTPTPPPAKATPPARIAEDDERVEGAVPFATPAPAMRKLDAVLGAWTFEETWTHPSASSAARTRGCRDRVVTAR